MKHHCSGSLGRRIMLFKGRIHYIKDMETMNKRNSDQDDIFNDDEFSEYEYRRGGGYSSTNLDPSDIDLSELSIAPEEDDLADIEDIIEQQSYENRRVMDGISNIPSGVNLVP